MNTFAIDRGLDVAYELIIVNSGKVVAISDDAAQICEFMIRLNSAYADFVQGHSSNKVIL